MKKLLLLFIVLLTGVCGAWARTPLEYTALTTGVDYVLMDNGTQYFLAKGGKTNSISAANKYQIVDAGDGKYYLMQTSTSQYVARETNDATVTWTSNQEEAEKFTINKQNNNTRVRFVSSTNSSYFLNSQGSNSDCPYWRNGTGDWSYWIVYKYDDFFVPTANKGYKLKMKDTDLYVKFRISGYTEDAVVNATILASEGSIFKVESKGLTNTLMWKNEYVKTSSEYSWNAGHGTDISNSTWYIEPVSGEANTYYIKKSSAASGSIFFGNKQDTPAAGQNLYTDQDPSKASNYNVKWVLEETTNVARMQENGFGPETSTAGSPKYYTIMNTRCGKYAKYAGDAAKMNLITDRLGSTANAFWFEAVSEGGLPEDVIAVKIHNVAAGKCVAATNLFTDDGITWYIKADVYTGTTSVAINKSSSVWNNNDNGWNNESNYGLNIAPYASTDIGSAWWIEPLSSDDYTALAANYSDDITTNIQPFIDGKGDGYFKLNDANATSLASMITSVRNDDFVTHEEYTELKNQLYNNLLTFPATGYYRIKSSGVRPAGETYITYGYCSDKKKYGLVTTPVANKYTDAGTVFKFTREGVAGGVYKLSTQGLNVQDESGYDTPFTATTAEGVTFVFETVAPGVVAIRHNTNDEYAYFHESGWASPSGVVRWEKGSASQWSVQDATEMNITLTTATDNGGTHTYATLCVPFAISNLKGANSKEVKAYAPNKSGDYIVPGDGTTTITEGTPVLLIGEEGASSVTATIGTNYATSPATTNVLTGTFTGTTLNCTAGTTNYVLGFDENNGNRIGFYHVSGGSSFALKANRAYLSTAGGSVKGFAINWDELVDGIRLTPDPSLSKRGEIYNLAGQKLSKPMKGVNIVNGKKVLVK